MGESGESLLYLFRDDIDSGDEGLSSKNIDKGSSSSTSESDDSITGEGDLSSLTVVSCTMCLNSGIGESGERVRNFVADPVNSGDGDLNSEIDFSDAGETGR